MNLETLLQHILPEEIFQYFDLKEIKEDSEDHLLLHLDEKSITPPEHSDKDLVSNGFDEPVCIQDFPIRKKASYLIVRRRKWKDRQTNKIYSRNWNLTASGTSYSKEFAFFLKGLFGQIPDQQ